MTSAAPPAVTPAQEALVEAARAARDRAHAPYSGFLVGAAVRADDGRVFPGCNVEISSFSHTCCAERVAVFSAIAQGARRLVACAVITDVSPPVTPCGACRQVLHEFGPEMTLVLADLAGGRRLVPLRALLPEAFGPVQVMDHIRARHGEEGP